jgi:hypothetical protein
MPANMTEGHRRPSMALGSTFSRRVVAGIASTQSYAFLRLDSECK